MMWLLECHPYSNRWSNTQKYMYNTNWNHLVVYIYVGLIYLYVCPPYHIWCWSGVRKGQKRVLNPLEIESQIVVSNHVSYRNWTSVLWKNNECLYHWPISPVPILKSVVVKLWKVRYTFGWGSEMGTDLDLRQAKEKICS